MQLIDIIFLCIIGAFGLFGFWFGFIHTLGSLLVTILGAYPPSRYYEPIAELIIRYTGINPNLSRVIMFVIAFIIINRLVGFVFWVVDKVLSLITRLPFIH